MPDAIVNMHSVFDEIMRVVKMQERVAFALHIHARRWVGRGVIMPGMKDGIAR
jgi:hypothetical protein